MPITGSISDIRPKILVIRRDNIGDLILTTPLIHALRRRFPDAWIGALVNSYNARVLEGNADIDEVFVYTKAKHRGAKSVWSAYWSTLKLILRLRRLCVDYAILASPAASSKAQMFARRIRARTIVGFGACASPGFSLEASPVDAMHEVEEVFRIAPLFGIAGPPPHTSVTIEEKAVMAARNVIMKALPSSSVRIAVHISARKPHQRWPAGRFVDFMRLLAQRRPELGFVLFWSPGEAASATHPGDDAKARDILEALRRFPITPCPTQTLSDLFAGIAACDQVICSDGGAMHVAAALGKPILCFFGDSDARHWHPWGAPYQLIQAQSGDVSEIAPLDAIEEFWKLQGQLGKQGNRTIVTRVNGVINQVPQDQITGR